MSVASTKGRGARGRGRTRGKRGGNLGHRNIGKESAQKNIMDGFGFVPMDTQATQAYNFDDDEDDFFDFEFPKNKGKNSSHKHGQSSTSPTAGRGAHKSQATSQMIDVDEDSHGVDYLLSEAGQSSKSVTPAEKSRSVTSDSQESKKSKSRTRSDPSRPVSSTSVISNKSSSMTISNTPLPFVDVGGGNTMADEDTTNDTIYNEIDQRTSKKSKLANDNQGMKLCRMEKPKGEESQLDRVSPVSEASGHSARSVEKSERKHDIVIEPVEPESQPMGTIDGSCSGPSSEQDVFTISESSEEKDTKSAKTDDGDNIRDRTKGTKVGNKRYTLDFVSSSSDWENEEKRQTVPLAKRLQLDRLYEAKKRSKLDADPDLAAALKLSKEEMVKAALDKPKDELSAKKKRCLKNI